MRTRSETLGNAVRTAVRNPGRSALTMLGLAIGVGAFIAMVSFGSGARGSVLQQFEVLGKALETAFMQLTVRGSGNAG